MKLFKRIKYFFFGEPLVRIKHGNFFVTTFDSKTQSFKKILYNEETKRFEIEKEKELKKVSEVITNAEERNEKRN